MSELVGRNTQTSFRGNILTFIEIMGLILIIFLAYSYNGFSGIKYI
jgi:hypothetical protein